MKPIINPWLFYLLNILDNLQLPLTILFCISLVTFGVLGYFKLVDMLEKEYEKLLLPTIIATCVIALLMIFIPTKETVIQMTAAKFVTPDNVESAVDVIQDTVDYVFDKMNSK